MYTLLMMLSLSKAEAVVFGMVIIDKALLQVSLCLSRNDNAMIILQSVQHWGSIKPSWILTPNVHLHSQLDMLYFQIPWYRALRLSRSRWSNLGWILPTLQPTTDGDAGLSNLMVSRLYADSQ